ncbi:MAG: CRISPR-associated endonuclease Cas1 [Petrotogales bacterium]
MIEHKLRNLVVSGYGSKVGKKGKLIYVETEENKLKISPKELEQLILFDEGKITCGAIRYLYREDVDVVFVDEKHNQFLRIVDGEENPLSDLWIEQMELGRKEKLRLISEILRASFYNKSRLLSQFGLEVGDLKERILKLDESESSDILRGKEGEFSKRYFSKIKKLIGSEFEFEKREKNPPPDPINSMLSYGYTVLKSRIQYSLLRAGLNPYIGILHESYRDRPALSFDMMEIFRSVIVDRTVLTMLNKGMIDLDDFEYPEEGICYITGDGKQSYLNELFKRMESKHEYDEDRLEFLDIMFLQAEELADHVKGKDEFKGFRWR